MVLCRGLSWERKYLNSNFNSSQPSCEDTYNSISLVVAFDYIPGYTNTNTIKRFLYSLRYLDFSSNCSFAKKILALDILHPRYNKEKFLREYEQFCLKLKKEFPELIICVPKSWGHLSGNLKNAFMSVQTEYVFVCQADLVFIREIDLGSLLPLPDGINHVLFNKGHNLKHLGVSPALQKEVGKLNLCKTEIWSDNNHLCKKTYYQETVFPLISGFSTFPERIMTEHRNSTNTNLGTYVYGAYKDSPYIRHIGDSKRVYLFWEKNLGNGIARVLYKLIGGKFDSVLFALTKLIWRIYSKKR